MQAHLVNKDTAVLTFAHMQSVSVGNMAVGVEACAYSTDASSTKKWCTAVKAIDPPANFASSPSATGDAGHVALAIPSFGLVVLDTAAKTAPELQLIYSQGSVDDCCVPTALEIVTEVAATATVVASIPRGTMDGIWCRCQGSKLVGVAVPESSPDRYM